ncbi:SpoIIE family protein phosphatase [Planomonospora parontospora]|uniref:SpoIIE family protein phosphatase n=1 Tax=Planomonospora parontospora TaxID=58119 RepID=UPI001942678C|nr:SpoIIE family protein phosphatase [Planomonospora parontospora]GGL27612.1 TorS-related protein [Planomonospora parontospora subsp. antibiotica]GII16501.1 TorS-related protein [Planomonospora parontospora subsp. antibiotica]
MGTLTQAEHQRHMISAEEDVGAVRRAVAATARRLPRLREGESELVATELATNVLRHARAGGYVLHRPTGEGLELLAVDRGPGGASPGVPRWAVPGLGEQAPLPPFGGRAHMGPGAGPDVGPGGGLGGGLGVGLGAVRRRASAFDCYSGPGGTVVLIRIGPCAPASAGAWRWGGVNVPLGGAGDSGDAWAVAADGCLTALVADGLGHGPAAAQASRAAVSALEHPMPGHSPSTGLDGLVRRAHEAMRGTRGGVLGVCTIGPDRLSFAGVGNIAGRLLPAGENPRRSHGLLSHHGTLGVQLAPPRTRVSAYGWGPGAVLVVTSDGITSRCDPLAYPGLLERDPAVIAAVLQRDHGRDGDDSTVLVVRDVREPAVPDVREDDSPAGTPRSGGS